MLGYSGGPDSKALLYALKKTEVPLHVAHVDHGWRKESGEEADALEQEVAELGLPFYRTRLEGCDTEETARAGRLQFFAGLFQATPFQALLLAHQADDWAETALKRVLEGAHLPFLGGMDEVGHLYGMPIWRPFLKISKQALELYLQKLGLTALQDPTNADPAYLRSRMRVEIFPFLERSLGKRVVGNLRLLAERAAELKKFLDKRVEGKELDELEERIERRHLLQSQAKEQGIVLRRDRLEAILDAMDSKSDE